MATTQPFCCEMQRHVLEVTQTAKYLGMIIDDKLTWLLHPDYLSRRCDQPTAQLWRSGRSFELRDRRTWYLSMLQWRLLYASNAFSPSLNRSLISCVVKLSKAALRAVIRVQARTESSPLRRQLKVKAVTHLYHEKQQILSSVVFIMYLAFCLRISLMFFRVIMKAESARVRLLSHCESLPILGHPVVRPCTSSVPCVGISNHTIYSLSVTCHNLIVQYQKLIFCIQLRNILTTFKLKLINTFIPITYPSS